MIIIIKFCRFTKRISDKESNNWLSALTKENQQEATDDAKHVHLIIRRRLAELLELSSGISDISSMSYFGSQLIGI